MLNIKILLARKVGWEEDFAPLGNAGDPRVLIPHPVGNQAETKRSQSQRRNTIAAPSKLAGCAPSADVVHDVSREELREYF